MSQKPRVRQDRFVVVYLEDIVIYSESLNDHLKHLRAIFQKLRKYELYAKKEKCEFCCEQIYVPWACDQPRKDSDGPVKRRFIKGYSKIVNLLTDLLRKDQKWEWTVACDDAFSGSCPQSKLVGKRFDFEWVHRSGKHNDVTDALSQKLIEE
ncbi:Transposon Ty3-G Gag-Pol polyprotein [Sesamum angolense]|uniref:Transposon Ty3-G Gag-Pol polyprotein n=1 Tax=Sesamum angolense TaxID=2727404 RepID=A0AAE2BZI1_9LAMI|nr:Transposon Ty3-G Gag-Pol polyprotein [Sesamum angolense]